MGFGSFDQNFSDISFRVVKLNTLIEKSDQNSLIEQSHQHTLLHNYSSFIRNIV